MQFRASILRLFLRYLLCNIVVHCSLSSVEHYAHLRLISMDGALDTDVNTQSMQSSKDSGAFNVDSRWIRLNVGGQVFQTTKQTLCRDANSFLARLCNEDSELASEKDENGAFLIDRDAQYFSPVLNYLRHGKLVVNSGISIEGVLEEADFYNLPGLSHLCAERIVERETKKAACSQTKHVYRVLQCHEEELTTVVSAVSDGWKFEQLIPIGAAYNYSTEMPPEYLCVVSRECPDVANGNGAESHDRAKLLQQRARHN